MDDRPSQSVLDGWTADAVNWCEEENLIRALILPQIFPLLFILIVLPNVDGFAFMAPSFN